MIKYYYKKLTDCKEYYDDMMKISNKARKARDLPEMDFSEKFPKWEKKGLSTYMVFEDTTLIGYTLITHFYELADTRYWIDFKVWLFKNNYNINNLGVRFFSYTDPDYWNKGITKEFIRYVSEHSEYDYIVTFQFPHKDYEDWMKHVFPDIIDTGFKSPNKTGVYLIPKK